MPERTNTLFGARKEKDVLYIIGWVVAAFVYGFIYRLTMISSNNIILV